MFRGRCRGWRARGCARLREVGGRRGPTARRHHIESRTIEMLSQRDRTGPRPARRSGVVGVSGFRFGLPWPASRALRSPSPSSTASICAKCQGGAGGTRSRKFGSLIRDDQQGPRAAHWPPSPAARAPTTRPAKPRSTWDLHRGRRPLGGNATRPPDRTEGKGDSFRSSRPAAWERPQVRSTVPIKCEA